MTLNNIIIIIEIDQLLIRSILYIIGNLHILQSHSLPIACNSIEVCLKAALVAYISIFRGKSLSTVTIIGLTRHERIGPVGTVYKT